MKSVLSESDANLIVFNTLVGLRPSESIKCLEIIQNQLDNYWNKDRSILEHYKFPNEFIRRTKNVYISVVTPSIIELAQKNPKKTSYNSLKLMLEKTHSNEYVLLSQCLRYPLAKQRNRA